MRWRVSYEGRCSGFFLFESYYQNSTFMRPALLIQRTYGIMRVRALSYIVFISERAKYDKNDRQREGRIRTDHQER